MFQSFTVFFFFFNCFVYLQGILHHISALSEKKGEAENSAKENKVPF